MLKFLKYMIGKLVHRNRIHRNWEKRGGTYKNEKMLQVYELTYEYLADMCSEEKPKSVLEYGCGYAYLLKKIYKKTNGKCQRYFGFDFSGTQVAQAKNYFPQGHIEQNDICSSGCFSNQNPFDIVIGLSVLMYIHPGDIDNAISCLARICKKKLFLVEYYYKYLSPEKKVEYDKVVGNTGDGRFVYDYEGLLNKHGFINVRSAQIPAMVDSRINVKNCMPHTLVIAEKRV